MLLLSTQRRKNEKVASKYLQEKEHTLGNNFNLLDSIGPVRS